MELLNTMVVTTLNEYGKIPVDFLCKHLNRRRSEILPVIEELEKVGVIAQVDDNVQLAEKSR